MRVIDAEHPHLSATQIDVDDATDPGHVARQLQSRSGEDETAWRDGQWYTARLRPGPLRPADRRTTVVDHGRDGMRLHIRTPGDLESLELTAFDRVPPGPGEIEVAVASSTINFADVLVAFGRYPMFEGYQQQLGGDFAGVVTAVGPGVTEHRVGDRVGGLSGNGCWAPSCSPMPGTRSPCRRRFRFGTPPRCRPHRPPPGTACTTWPASRRPTRC